MDYTQTVKLGSSCSDPIHVPSEVPQGRHLSSIQFLLFINGLSESITLYCYSPWIESWCRQSLRYWDVAPSFDRDGCVCRRWKCSLNMDGNISLP